LTEEWGDLEIIHVFLERRVLHCRDLRDRRLTYILQLPTESKSDREMYAARILARWALLRERWRNDEDYTDYLPGIFETLADMHAGNLEVFDGSPPFCFLIVVRLWLECRKSSTPCFCAKVKKHETVYVRS